MATTNYYAKIKIDSQAYKSSFLNLKQSVTPEEKFERVHIGKAYNGNFLFNLNKKKYYTNKETLISWLKNVEITTENDDPINFEGFFEGVVMNNGPRGKKLTSSRIVQIDGLDFLDADFK